MLRLGKRLSDSAPPRDLQQLIKTTRILVIDDVETEFPFAILKSQGYSIDYWSDVQDLPKLEAGFYDIIVLDIGGVGHLLDDKHEGAAVLKHLKKVNPSQIVVAYSGQSHDTHRIPFFQLADQYVPKPTNALSWKEILDDIIQQKRTVPHLWRSLRDQLSAEGVPDDKIRKLEKAILKQAGRSGADPHEVIKSTLGTVDKLTTFAGIVGKIFLLFA